jgi:hypothetical protein
MNARSLKLSIAMLLTAGAVTTIVPQAQANMTANYVGGTAAGVFGGDAKTFTIDPAHLTVKESSQTEFQASIDGRYRLPIVPVSARGSVYVNQLSFQATGTYDMSILPNVGAYIGGGVHVDKFTSPVVQVGAEARLNKTIVYGGFDYLTRLNTGVAKVGFGYRF